MAGALAERDFVDKLQRHGFERIQVMDRTPWGIADCALYPLFDDDLIALMRKVIPADRQDHVGDSIVVRAIRRTSTD